MTRDDLTHKIACVATTDDLQRAFVVRNEILDNNDALVDRVAKLEAALTETSEQIRQEAERTMYRTSGNCLDVNALIASLNGIRVKISKTLESDQ